ncbi:hypothetical protein ABIF93_003008 [Bradyrhizobium japonicum]
MIGLVRAVTLCATLALGLSAALAADKAFKRDDLADSAIKLEAQIKSEAGPVAKTSATLRTDADAAFRRNDFRAGLSVLGQIAATTPEDTGNWLRLAKVIFQISPKSSSEQTFLLERASTAAYIAYQRAGNPGEEADALAVLGKSLAERKLWRPALDALRLSLDMREVADVRGQYEKMRDEHGFRLLDYTVDSDSASPRACFQFSEELAKRTDFAPYLALAGQDKPALSAEGKQLCVDGLKHGERYNINLRAGLPSTVKEGLPKSAEFNVYVRDRKPFMRFTSRAYVLPRTGQRGIPVVSVNTPAVNVNVFRIGDRNLINTVVDSDFQKTLSRYQLADLGGERGVKVWTGELATAMTLNQDVTTAFPVDQALGELQPGVYVMTAAAKGPGSDDDYQLATQWFIVSDLGVTAYSGNDGIHVFVNSLATTDPVGKAEVRLVARNNEILATRKTDDSGHMLFEGGPCTRRGRPVAGDADGHGREGRLCLPEPEDLGFRPVRPRRFGPGGAIGRRCFRLCRARRLSLQRDRLSHRALARRAGQRRCRRAADAGDRAPRRRRIPPRRARRPGRRRPHAVGAAQFGRPDRDLAGPRLHRSEGLVGRRNHLHGRGLRP